MDGVLLLLPRAPAIRPTSRKSRKAAPALLAARGTDYHMPHLSVSVDPEVAGTGCHEPRYERNAG